MVAERSETNRPGSPEEAKQFERKTILRHPPAVLSRERRRKEELVGNLLIFANDPSNEESGLGSLSESDIEALNESTHPNNGVVKLPLFAI